MITKTTDDYTNCVAVYPRGGKRYAHAVRTALSNTAGEAIERLENDNTAYVLPELYQEVADRWAAIQEAKAA